MTSYHSETNMNNDWAHYSNDTQASRDRRDMGTSSATIVPKSGHQSGLTLEANGPETPEHICQENRSSIRDATATRRAIDMSKILQALATKEGEERIIQKLLSLVDYLARHEKWDRMKWLPTSQTLWSRTPQHVRERFLKWRASTFVSDGHSASAPAHCVTPGSTADSELAVTPGDGQGPSPETSGLVPTMPASADNDLQSTSNDDHSVDTDSSTALQVDDTPAEQVGKAAGHDELDIHIDASAQPTDPVIGSHDGDIDANETAQFSEPAAPLNNVYVNGKQAPCHGSRQAEIYLNDGPWVKMTGKDREEERARRAKRKALESSSAPQKTHKTKRKRGADGGEGNSGASTRKKKRAKTSANAIEGDVSSTSGHDGWTSTGVETLHKVPNDTTANSDVGEGPSTGVAQALSFGAPEE